MILLLLIMCLVAELQSAAQVSLDDLKTTNAKPQKEIVDKHNELRRSVKPPARNMLKMMWSPKITASAQKWADKCTLEHSLEGDRRIDGKNCGENLFMGSIPFSWSYACESWYNETEDFIYGVGASRENAVVGHYTQVAWATSWEVGCGYAYCPNQPVFKHYFVCQYSPPGNFEGRRATPYETGKPCADCTNNCDNGLCTNPCRHENTYSNCDDLVNSHGCNKFDLDKICKASCACPTEIR